MFCVCMCVSGTGVCLCVVLVGVGAFEGQTVSHSLCTAAFSEMLVWGSVVTVILTAEVCLLY